MIARIRSQPDIRRAGLDEGPDVARLVAVAFADLDVCRWLVPGTALARRLVLPEYFGILVDHALAHGRIDVTRGLRAAAIWIPAGSPTDPDIWDYDRRLAMVCQEHLPRFQALDSVTRANHPDSHQHEHLALLAVSPERQGEGLGGALLAHRHADLDRRGVPAYLEAVNPDSARLYERHGYIHIGCPIAPHGCGVPLYPMWRAARTSLPSPDAVAASTPFQGRELR